VRAFAKAFGRQASGKAGLRRACPPNRQSVAGGQAGGDHQRYRADDVGE